MTTMSACAPAVDSSSKGGAAPLSIEEEIEQFLDGTSNGHHVLTLLYGPAEDEPVPERFRALLRRHCPRLVK